MSKNGIKTTNDLAAFKIAKNTSMKCAWKLAVNYRLVVFSTVVELIAVGLWFSIIHAAGY